MKRTICLSSILLSLPFAWLPPVAWAQNAPTVTVPGVDVEVPRKTEPIAPTPDRKTKEDPAQAPGPSATKPLPRFSTESAKLGETIQLLQSHLEVTKQPRLNVLFGPECEDAKHPPIELYNVTGPDALLLIAAAADCVAQPIHSMETGAPERTSLIKPPTGDKPELRKVIGYRIQRNPIAQEPLGAMPGMPGMGSEAVRGASLTITAPGAPTTPPPLSRPGGMAPGGFANEPTRKGSASPKAWEVRVYALGALHEFLPKEKVMSTLHEVLDNVGAHKTEVDAKFHDNSNILIVRAPAETQRLVTKLLEALELNAAKGTYKDPPYDRHPVPQPIPRKVVPPSDATTEVLPPSEPKKD